VNFTDAIRRHGQQKSDSDDTALVIAAKAGEGEAFTELITRHRKLILTVAQRITNNHADAEDVFQTTCLQAFVHVCRFDGRSKFSTWQTRIAINSALMVLRRNRAANATSMNDLVEGDSYRLRDQRVDIWAEIQERERAWHVERAICQLQPCLRSVMQIQRQFQGSIKQTAELSGLSIPATKSRLFRARRELRRHLQACV
jgi:RNA polymerase sigma-70 factor (ECF subfamily)